MLEFWGIQSTTLFPSLTRPIWFGVEHQKGHMGQIELIDVKNVCRKIKKMVIIAIESLYLLKTVELFEKRRILTLNSQMIDIP